MKPDYMKRLSGIAEDMTSQPTDQPSETESVSIGSKSVVRAETPVATRPICGKCGKPMSPEDSTIHPELFMHDACLPTELLLREAQAEAPVAGVEQEPENANQILIESESAERLLGFKDHPIIDRALSGFADEVISTLTSRVAELERTNDAYQKAITDAGFQFVDGDGEVYQNPDDFIRQLTADLATARAEVEALTKERDEAQVDARTQIMLVGHMEIARDHLRAERDAYALGCESAKRDANHWHEQWNLNQTEKINLRSERNSLRQELEKMRGEG